MADLIDRQAAIDAIKRAVTKEAAIWSVESLPSAQPKLDEKDHPEQGDLAEFGVKTGETCADAISRQAAIDALDVGAELLRRVLDEVDVVGAEREKYKWGLGLIESCISDMKELPSAQTERTQGRWIPQDNNKVNGMTSTTAYYYPKCSVCGHCANYTNFCPDCGADMRGKQNETD